MSFVAPVAPDLGLGPLSRRCSSSDIAARVLAAISRASSSVADTHLSRVMPMQLSLKGLLQSENVHTIQENLAVLARFADHLPRDVDTSTPRITNDELLIMGNLVRGITASLENIGSLRADEDDSLPTIADKYVPMPPISSVTRRRRREKMKLKMAHKCHNCSRLETPQWRPGPNGPRTLCNVCGLIYTKRQQRHSETK